jgi:hypothetical protein
MVFTPNAILAIIIYIPLAITNIMFLIFINIIIRNKKITWKEYRAIADPAWKEYRLVADANLAAFNKIYEKDHVISVELMKEYYENEKTN